MMLYTGTRIILIIFLRMNTYTMVSRKVLQTIYTQIYMFTSRKIVRCYAKVVIHDYGSMLLWQIKHRNQMPPPPHVFCFFLY